MKDSTKIKVYVYTATNGYSWQGCGDDTAESLRSCLGSSWKNAAAGGTTLLGGIRRGSVDGLNGTAVYRVHVRKSGDFAGRDSDYVALAFIPFRQIEARFVDYAGLWRHELLKAPLGKNENLAGLEIDLDEAGLLQDAPAEDGSGTDRFWTDDNVPMDDADGDETDVLSRLGAAFQSRKSELGSFVASIYGGNGGSVSFQARYKPFPEVLEAVLAHGKYAALCAGSGSERDRADAFKAWSNAVHALLEMTRKNDGRFRHFLGLRQFAESEESALNAGRDSAGSIIVRLGLKHTGAVLDALEKHLDGDDKDVLTAVKGLVDEFTPFADQVGGGDGRKLQAELEALGDRLDEAEKSSHAVAGWIEGQTCETGTGQIVCLNAPSQASNGLKVFAECLRNARRSSKEKADRIAELQKRVTELEKAGIPGNVPTAASDSPASSASGERAERPRKRKISVVGFLTGVLALAFGFLAGFFGRPFVDGLGCSRGAEKDGIRPAPAAETNAVPTMKTDAVPAVDADAVRGVAEESALADEDNADKPDGGK